MTEHARACSLSSSGQAGRAAEFRALAARALVERERRENAVLLRFRPEPDVRDAVEDLARRERECCPFLDLQVAERDGRVTLSVGAAPEDRAALDAFYELAS